jgi:5-carboxymethyl-2-hydroxymuconate isomerase
MPHVIVEYSANLEHRVDISGLLRTLHQAMLATGVAEIGALRTRAARRDHYVIADGDPANAFVAITLRLGHGRDKETRAGVAQGVFDAACRYLEPDYAKNPLAISLELEEIPPPGSLKHNNLHARMRAKQAA